MKMHTLVCKALDICKREGAAATVKRTINYLYQKKHPAAPPLVDVRLDVVGTYRFLYEQIMHELPDMDSEPEERSINWVIPDVLSNGAGGVTNIFRCIAYLQKKGFKNRIYFYNCAGSNTMATVKSVYEGYYQEIAGNAEYYSAHFDSMKPASAIFATSWPTAYFVREIKNCRKKFYFVQDFETYFYPHGSDYGFAENPYKWGFVGITASPWLKEQLEAAYGMRCYAYGFSYEKEIYYPRPRTNTTRQIVFYARATTPRRAFEAGVIAFYLVSRRMPDVRFVFVGEEIGRTYRLPFDYVDAGVVTPQQLAEYYSNSDICVALSCSNISLLPLEIMGCRSVVMSNDGDHVRWLLNEENSILVELDPQQMADTICEYLEQPEKLEKLRQQGYEFAQQTSWDTEYEKVAQAMEIEME